MITKHDVDETIQQLAHDGYEVGLELAPTVAEKTTEALIWASRKRTRRRFKIALATMGIAATVATVVVYVRRRRAAGASPASPEDAADQQSVPTEGRTIEAA